MIYKGYQGSHFDYLGHSSVKKWKFICYILNFDKNTQTWLQFYSLNPKMKAAIYI